MRREPVPSSADGERRQGRGDRVYFTWESRLYWAMQTGMLIAACLLVAKGFGNLLFAIPVVMPLLVILVRELRMGLQIRSRDGSVMVRRVFRDLVLPPRNVATFIINRGDVDSAMWGLDWNRHSTVLVLRDGRQIWVNGIESKSMTVLEALVADFLARVPGHRKAA